MPPGDLVSVLCILSYDSDEEVSQAARSSFQRLAEETVSSAMETDLDPVVVKRLNALQVEKAAPLNSTPHGEGAFRKGQEVKPGGQEQDASERTEAKKPETAPSDSTDSTDLPAPTAPTPPRPEPGAEDAESPDIEEEVEPSLIKQIESMTVGQKIKLALTGDNAVRGILIKDSNRQIAGSVLKNPRIKEDEVLKITATKGTSDELLRIVARNKEWLKNYHIKNALVTNPRTPLRISMKLITQLKDKDLLSMSNSKNISAALASSARRTLQIRQKH